MNSERACARRAGAPKSPEPACLAPGTENRSKDGAQAAGTEGPTGGAQAGSGGLGLCPPPALRLRGG